MAFIAFAGRAAYVMLETRHQQFPGSPDASGPRRSLDEAWYTTAARNLAEGNGVKISYGGGPAVDDAQHPPFTAIALAPTAFFFDGDTPLRLTVALFGGVTVFVIGLAAAEVAGHRAGVIAAVIAAVYPNLWMNDGLVMSETFAALLTASTVLFAYRFTRRRSAFDAVAAGVAAGLAMLTRSELVLFVPLLVVPAILRAGLEWKRALRLAAASVLASAIVVAPWIIYNQTRFTKPVYLSYADGDVLTGANCDPTYYGPLIGFVDNFCTIPNPTGDLSVDVSAKRTQAFDYMRGHLSRLPIVVAARVGRVWGAYRPVQMARIAESEGRPEWASMLGWLMSWPLIALAIAGCVSLRRRGVQLLPLLAPAIVATLNAAAFFGFVRHRIPAEVSIVVLAAVALDAWMRARARTRPGYQPRSASLTSSSPIS